MLEQILSEIQQSRPACVGVFRLLDAGWLFQARFTSIWCNRSRVYVCLWHYHLMSDSRCISFCVLYVCVFNLWRIVWKIIFAIYAVSASAHCYIFSVGEGDFKKENVLTLRSSKITFLHQIWRNYITCSPMDPLCWMGAQNITTSQ